MIIRNGQIIKKYCSLISGLTSYRITLQRNGLERKTDKEISQLITKKIYDTVNISPVKTKDEF